MRPGFFSLLHELLEDELFEVGADRWSWAGPSLSFPLQPAWRVPCPGEGARLGLCEFVVVPDHCDGMGFWGRKAGFVPKHN